MSENKVPKTIGVDELTQALTAATVRGLKSEQPLLAIEKSGLIVSFRVYCGIPPVIEEAGGVVQPSLP